MTPRSSTPSRLLPCLLVVAFAGSSLNPATADDFHGYWVNEYDSLGNDMYGACDNDDLNWNDDFALAFRDEIDTWSGWTHNVWGNGSVRAERFVDEDVL